MNFFFEVLRAYGIHEKMVSLIVVIWLSLSLEMWRLNGVKVNQECDRAVPCPHFCLICTYRSLE